MHVPPAERTVIDLLDQFRQLTTGQLRALAFPAAASRTSCDRVLSRMYATGYISRVIQRRPVGGGVGGSGEHIYELGREGFRLAGRTERWRSHTISYHSLAIGDVAIRLRQAERDGTMIVRSMVTEPECWVTVQGIELRPDLAVELGRPGSDATLAAFIEVDLGTERAGRISEKLGRYMDAYKRATLPELPEYRRIYFVSENERRRAEIEWLIGKLGEDERKYFRSVELSRFPAEL